MPVIQLLLYLASTCVLIRLLAIRSTISSLTLLKYFITGMLLGVTLLVPIQKLVEPYYEEALPEYVNNVATHFLLSLVTLLVLYLPVARILAFPNTKRIFSVADFFLFGFATGAGTDFIGILLAGSAGAGGLKQFSFFPPLVQEITVYSVAYNVSGLSYRLALIAMTFFLLNKYLKNRMIAFTGAGFLLILLSYETALLKTSSADNLPVLLALLLKGSLVAWGTIMILIGFSWKESKEINHSNETVTIRSQLSIIWDSIVTFQLRKFFLQCRLLRLHRQLELTSTSASGGRNVWTRFRDKIEDQIKKTEAQIGIGHTVQPPGNFSSAPLFTHAIPVLIFIAVICVFLIPGGTTTSIYLLVAAYIIYKYLLTTDGKKFVKEGDDIASAVSDKTIVIAALAAWLAAMAGVVTKSLYPHSGVPFSLTGKLDPQYATWVKTISVTPAVVDPSVFVLLIALMGCSLVKQKSWQIKKVGVFSFRNNSLLRVAAIILILLAAHRFYMWGIQTLHNDYGDVLYYIGSQPAANPETPATLPAILKGIHFEKPPPFGNNVAAWFMTLSTVVVGLLALTIYIIAERFVSKNKINIFPNARAKNHTL